MFLEKIEKIINVFNDKYIIKDLCRLLDLLKTLNQKEKIKWIEK